MPNIQSMGIGSGLDIAGITSSLVNAARAPQVEIQKRQASYQAKITALGSVKSGVAQFQQAVNGLTDTKQFLGLTPTSSNDAVASASVVSASTLKPGTHTLEVKSLAQIQTLESKAFASADAAVGTGKLKIEFGRIRGGVLEGGHYRPAPGEPATAQDPGTPDEPASFEADAALGTLEVDITAGNNTLGGIRDAINNQHGAVSASLVDDLDGKRLVLHSTESGVAHSLRITASNEAGEALKSGSEGLGQIAFDPAAAVGAGQNLSETANAQDAVVQFDGSTLRRTSNVLSDLIEGASVTLKEVGKTTLGFNHNNDVAMTNVQNFVKAYNQLHGDLAKLTAYDPATRTAALLQGNTTVRTLQSGILSILNGRMAGDGPYRYLADLGFSFSKAGGMTLDDRKFGEALSKNPSAVAALFGEYATVSDSQVSYLNASGRTEPGSYPVVVTQMATQGILRAAYPRTYDLSAYPPHGVPDAAEEEAGDAPTDALLDGAADKTDQADPPDTPTSETETNRKKPKQDKRLEKISQPLDFRISVNGIRSGVLTLDAKDYGSFEKLASEIQGKINTDKAIKSAGLSASVSYDKVNNTFTLRSGSFGNSSKVSFDEIGEGLRETLGFGSGEVATLIGGTVRGQEITEGSNRFTLRVGEQQHTISLTPGSYTGQSLADEIQRQLLAIPAAAPEAEGDAGGEAGANAEAQPAARAGDTELARLGVPAIVVFNEAANRLEFSATQPGEKIAITQPSVDLGAFGIGNSEGGYSGLNVAGNIGQERATGSGQYLTGAGRAQGLQLKIVGGPASPSGEPRGTVVYNRGFALQLNQYLSSVLGEQGGFQQEVNTLNKLTTDGDKDVAKLETRLKQLQQQYTTQFTNMDIAVSKMKKTSDQITQQLGALRGDNGKR